MKGRQNLYGNLVKKAVLEHWHSHTHKSSLAICSNQGVLEAVVQYGSQMVCFL
jgi:hypothetical protein